MTGEMLASNPGDFGKLVTSETVKWRTVVKEAKISAN